MVVLFDELSDGEDELDVGDDEFEVGEAALGNRLKLIENVVDLGGDMLSASTVVLDGEMGTGNDVAAPLGDTDGDDIDEVSLSSLENKF